MSNPETIRRRRTQFSDLIIGAVRVLYRPTGSGAASRGILALASAAVFVGLAFAANSPRPQTSDAAVLFATPLALAPAHGQAARAAADRLLAIARSRPVLASAGEALKPPMSVQALQRLVDVTIVGSDEIQISAQAATAARAQTVADAIASSYMGYANEKLRPDDTPMMLGMIVSQGPSHVDYILDWVAPWALSGGLLGAIGASAVRRRARWIQRRP